MMRRVSSKSKVLIIFSLLLFAAGSARGATTPSYVPFSTEGLIPNATTTVSITFMYMAGGELTVYVGDFGGPLDPMMTLIGPNRREFRDDDGGPGDDAVIVFTKDNNSAPAGLYRLAVSGQSGTRGRFSVSVVPTAMAEPTRSTLLGFGDRIQRHLNHSVDMHVYHLYAQKGDFIEVYLTDFGSALDPFLTLAGPAGFQGMSDDDSGPLDDALIQVPSADAFP